ncbi:MAG TPA: PTS sugar transporter subunit IIA, partial [Planctomycetota bacterium]|nr:PTS sugar transporter subunit IIA [Planctomycetota bacterium]
PPERIVELAGTDKKGALRELAEVAARAKGMPAPEVVLQAILEREELLPTGIGMGIAVPHCKDKRMKEFSVALGRTPKPIEYGSTDGLPVRILAMIVAPDSRQDEYLRLLSRVTKFLRTEREKMLELKNLKDIHEVVHTY